MMNFLNLNIYGYGVKITSDDFETLKLKISSDFEYFAVSENATSQLLINIKTLSEFKPEGFFIGKTSMCEVRQVTFNKRQLIFRHETRVLAVVSDLTTPVQRLIEISALDINIVDDVLYFLINSCCGEYLDSRGLIRIHAMSYSSEQKTGLVYGFPGSGKSTLALALLKNENVKIFSDEISIYDLKKNILLPFPIRIALPESHENSGLATKFTYFFNKKYLMPLAPNKIATSLPLNNFYYLENYEKPHLFYYFCIIFGVGLIQMWEYLLRFNNLAVLFKVFIYRIKLCLILYRLGPVSLKRNLPLQDKITLLL